METMSRSNHKEKAEAHVHRTPKPTRAEILSVTEQLDTTLKHLCERIIPSQPYLLSVPSDIPYRHSSRFVNTWYIGTPFLEEEEQLQYLTFLSYQAEEDSLLRVVGSWADEKGNLLESEAASPASLSGHNTPIEQPNRKKISLKDYKTKDKVRPSTPTGKPPVEDLRKQVMKSEAKEYALNIEDGQSVPRIKEKPYVKVERREIPALLRSNVDGARSPRPTAQSRRDDLPSPRKRRRLSSESPRRETIPIKPEKVRETEDTKNLPLLLSPTLPAGQNNSSNKTLPGLLLPDLPPALEKLVAKADTKSKLELISTPRSEQVKSVLGNTLTPAPEKRPAERLTAEAGANRVRSDSQASTRPATATPKVQSPMVRPSLKTLPRPVTPLQNGMSASPKPRQRHIVALKYGRKNRKRVEALLRFPARPKKQKPPAEEPVAKLVEPKPVSAKPVSDVAKADRKRPAEPSPERPVKKVKAFETPEKPRTSVMTAVKSPAVTTTLPKQKAEVATPMKEQKASAMKRVESQDGLEVRTPQPDRGRISTPLPVAGSSQTKVSPGPSNSMSKEDRAGWTALHSKFHTLGRNLKREGTSLGQNPSNDRSEKDSVLSVVSLIEALLCFMINTAAQSQARVSVDPGWESILPYHIFVFRASRKYRHLHGLVIQLGAICRQAIHHHHIDRLAKEPLPFEHFESAPTPGSDGTTQQNSDVDKSKKKYVWFRDQLVLNARELQSAWMEGSRYLSPMLVEREYPKTWAKRSKDASKRGVEKVKHDAISREYYLPLDMNSTAFEATRFALALLKEWTEKEKIDWKPRIEL